MWVLAVLYLLLCAADVYITLKCVKYPYAKEMNPLMRLFIKNKTAFIIVSVLINGFALFVMVKYGWILAVPAILWKGMVVYNNWLVWKYLKSIGK